MGAVGGAMLAGVLAIAFAAALLAGVAGYGTGLILPPVLAPLIGPAVVPVIALSALFSNLGRVIAYRHHLRRDLALRFGVLGLPGTVLAAWGYTWLSGRGVLILVGVTLLVLVPLRRLARRRQLVLARRSLDGAAAGYGVIVGGTAGSGIVLLTILMSAGLSGMSVIATDAAISIALGTVKVATMAAAGALSWDMALLGLAIGAAGFPAAFLSKRLAQRIGERVHLGILDAAVLVGAVLLIVEGLRG
jgi:uncharacterized membrane protein YfcA